MPTRTPICGGGWCYWAKRSAEHEPPLASVVGAPSPHTGMLGRDHALTGAAGTLALAPGLATITGSHLGPTQMAVAGLVGAGFAMLPDLDEPGSTVARRFGLAGEATSHVVRAAGGHRQATHSLCFIALVAAGMWWADRWAWTGPVVVVCCLVVAGRCILPLRLGRGMLGALVLPVAAGWWAWHAETDRWALSGRVAAHSWPWLAAMATAGVVWHIVGDALTVGGVPLLWPLRQRVALPLLGHTASARESLVGGALVLATAGLVWLRVLGPALAHHVWR